MNEKAVPFFSVFEDCETDELTRPLFCDASVISATVDGERRTMQVEVELKRRAAPVLIERMQENIAAEFDLSGVTILPFYENAAPGKKSAPKNEVLMGREIKKQPMEISEINLETGRVCVEGTVFDVETHDVKKRNAKILDFDITDNTSSIHVSKFLSEEEGTAAADKIKDGNYLMVEGNVSYNRWIGDINIEPQNIMRSVKEERKDTAKEKRVELHLHTRFSSLDALTDPAAAVKTAERWGHRAIAITDHGVVQGFPDAYFAAKNIKIIYGVEGYFINDIDDRLAVRGECEETLPLDCEYVAFDLETTGLDSGRDRIIEIGAVLFKDGEEKARFQTFVNPCMKIPQRITGLTGIKDSDVENAPGEAEAVRAFLKFAGNRPLVAHNAEFDTGFVSEACRREKIEFEYCAVDTLVLAQNMLPELRHHTLDSVANYLSLPEFRHHRASDDALTLVYMMKNFVQRLSDMGVCRLCEINNAMEPLRKKSTANYSPKHIIILAKNAAGLKNLYKLVSLGHLEHFRRYPIIPKSEILSHREGLIIGSACESGEFFTAVAARKSEDELLRIASFYDYLEIQPICNNEFMLYNGRAKDEEELRDFNRKVISIAKAQNKPVVATGDVHFLEPEDEIFRKILLASKKFADADRDLPIYFKTTQEMLEEFSYLGEELAYEVVVTNTNLIADMCDDVKPLPKGLFPPKIEGSAEELQSLVYGRMHELYGENPPELITTRVETELHDILECGYDVIYMSAQKLVSKSLEAGYLVGSRGSVGSSIVAYMSGITEVNSLPPHYRCPKCHNTEFEAGKEYGCGADMPDAVCPVCGTPYQKDGFDIPFETFLGFNGAKVPDIDLNFSGEYQAQAHRETINLFGAEHVFRAGTIGTIAEKTAYGYVKNYLAERGKTVSKAEENRLSRGLVGIKRTTGQHPGGLVVIPQDKEISDFCPVQHPADSTDTDIITTHFEYHCMESNLLKLDLLGHDDPSMIRMLEDLTGLDAKQIPLDDPDTMSIFNSPKALGLPDDDPIIGKTGSIAVPEFGTKFTREMLVDTQPKAFSTLLRISGFSHGTDVWLGNAKDLITSGTATVMQAIGCRDDIMLYLISMGMDAMGAFKIMEAVRKGKGLTPEWENDMRKANVPEWYIDSCKKIKYLFPKAHAVAYVMMAFRIAWFKVHEPLAFYASYFTIRAPAFDATIMIAGKEKVLAKMREIENKPDASAADKDMLVTLEVCYEFYMRGFEFENIDLYRSDSVKFTISENGLIPPFVALPGLGETAAKDIVAHRKDKEFISIEELSASCPKVSKSHIDMLRDMGVFGDLPDTSQISLF